MKGIENSPFLLGDIENLLIYLENENNTNTEEYLEKLKNYIIFGQMYNTVPIPTNLKKMYNDIPIITKLKKYVSII